MFINFWKNTLMDRSESRKDMMKLPPVAWIINWLFRKNSGSSIHRPTHDTLPLNKDTCVQTETEFSSSCFDMIFPTTLSLLSQKSLFLDGITFLRVLTLIPLLAKQIFTHRGSPSTFPRVIYANKTFLQCTAHLYKKVLISKCFPNFIL